jgi:mycothiol synthase
LRLEICRRLAWADITAVTALSESCVEADGDAPLSDRVARRLHQPRCGPDRNILVLAADPIGHDRVIGYAHLAPAPDAPGNSVEIAVHPSFRRRGVARILLRTAVEETPDGRIRLATPYPTPAARALARSAGLNSVRQREHLVLGPGAVPPADALPTGTRIRTFHPERDEPGWQTMHTRIPPADILTLADLRRRRADTWFDPEGLLVAEDTTAPGYRHLLGFAWATVHRDEWAPGFRGRERSPSGFIHLGGTEHSTPLSVSRALILSAVRWLGTRGVTSITTSTDHRTGHPGDFLRQLGFRTRGTDLVFSPR